MSTPLAHRLEGIPPTIFSSMSALALRTGSVNLGQGFPDADGPASVVAAARSALRGGANQYAPGPGVPALRQAIARHQQRHYDLELDPDRQVVVTTGCTEAVAAALLGLVNPGDEVQCTGVLPQPWAVAKIVCATAASVRRPLITSTSGISGAGLKKCMPTTRPGRCSRDDNAVTDNDDVLVARMVCAPVISSTCLSTSTLMFRFSTIASITKPALANAGKPSTGCSRASRSSHSSAVNLPRATSFSRSAR